MNDRTALRLTVHGRVQGVFYRDWTVGTARELDLCGWVRNERDGTVAAHLEGSPESLRAMIERMGEGPPAAQVERVDVAVREVEGLISLERR